MLTILCNKVREEKKTAPQTLLCVVMGVRWVQNREDGAVVVLVFRRKRKETDPSKLCHVKIQMPFNMQVDLFYLLSS
jgi:hypothetical protein